MAAQLEDLTPGALVRGLSPDPVTAVAVEWHGSTCVTLTYRASAGDVGHQLVFRSDESLEVLGSFPKEALDYDALGTSWPELARLAQRPQYNVALQLPTVGG